MTNFTDVERTTLGMCMRPKNFERALALGIHPSSFALPEHQMIFAAMLESDKAGKGTDVASLATRVPHLAAQLVEIRKSAPPTQNFEPYAEEVKALDRARTIHADLTALVRVVAGRKAFDPSTVLDREIEKTLERFVSTSSPSETGPKRIDQALTEFIPALERRIEERKAGKPPGISTGFQILDAVTGGGFAPGTINVFAARTGKGKTTLAVNFLHTAATAGYRCAYFTVEMLTGEILQKLMSLAGGINGTKLRIGDMTAADFDRFWDAQRRLYDKPIWFDDSTGASFEAMERAVHRLKRQGGLDLIVVDYIQQFHLEGRWKSTYERLTAVSHALKQMANRERVAVVALAQLNREAEKGEVQPDAIHIKDSGAIEQDSDLVVLIHDDPKVQLFVAKNRHGRDRFGFPVGANLAFNAFTDLNLNVEAFR